MAGGVETAEKHPRKASRWQRAWKRSWPEFTTQESISPDEIIAIAERVKEEMGIA